MKSNTKGLIWFLVIAFAITWVSILAIYLIGNVPTSGTGKVSSNPMVGLLSMLGTFGPAIAAFVVRKWVTREGFKDAGLHFNFRVGWSYYVWAVLAPLVGGVITVLVAGAAGLDVLNLSAISATDIVSWLVGSLIWTPILFGEEFGWRGYLQPRLAPGRPLLAALWMGLIWGIYHYAHVLSGITMSANPLALLIYPFYCIMGSIILGWLRDKSRSVWPACLAHAVGNVIVSGMTAKLLPNVSDISVFVFTLVGEAVVALVLVLSRRVPWSDTETQQATVQA